MERFSVALVARTLSDRDALARTFERAPASWSIDLHDGPPADADLVIAPKGIPADVVFDPAHPDEALVQARSRATARRRGTVQVVTSASSGCGVTSVALHLAASFARRAATCLVDLDLRGRGIAERLDLGETTKTWADAGEDEEALRLAALPVRGGFRVLLAPGNETDVEPHALVRRAAEQFRRVVVDLPATSPVPLTGSARLPDCPGVLVAPATPGGARRAADLLERVPDRRWALVFNRLGAGGQSSVAALARRTGRNGALELPCTPSLRDAEEEGRLLESWWTRWNRRIDRLARALERA